MASLVKFMQNSVLFSINKANTLLQTPSVLSGASATLSSKTNEISKRLGIPERPKKPSSSYMRFLHEIRPKLQASTTSVTEITRQAAAQWKNLSDGQKQKYQEAFERENVEFKKQLEAYEKRLTPEQKLALKEERKRLADHSKLLEQKRERKSQNEALGKPKAPLSSYVLFYQEAANKSSKPLTAVDVKQLWHNLPDSQKKPYIEKSNALRDTFNKQLDAWEKQMLSKGYIELVRKKTAAAQKPPKRTRKAKNEE